MELASKLNIGVGVAFNVASSLCSIPDILFSLCEERGINVDQIDDWDWSASYGCIEMWLIDAKKQEIEEILLSID